MKLNAKHTVAACFTGAMVQAIVINFSPLLFLTFERDFGISLSKISLLIAISFVTQLLMDLTATALPKLFNHRMTVVIGQICSALGLVGIAVLPEIMSPYMALVIATMIAAFGGGIIEVMGNPIIESCPVKNKNKILSFMHSCYCWGLVITVLVSTLFFRFVGIEHWQILACLWAIIPTLNAIAFVFVPIEPIASAPRSSDKKHSVFRTFTFWAFFILMLCAGAAEQAMSQWASSFAEMGLGVDKHIGDLLGPCAFAVLMGLARVIYAKYSEKMDLSKFMFVSSVLCIIAYLVAALSHNAIVSLMGCALCGFSVGIMWPGTLCLVTDHIPHGGVKVFALLALAGDAGCTIGPVAVGWIADLFGNNLKVSFLFSVIFPAVMILFIILLAAQKRKHNNRKELK